jgi:hypothetical protein
LEHEIQKALSRNGVAASSSPVLRQRVISFPFTFTANGDSSVINVAGSGVTTYKLSYVTTGGPATVSVKLQGSNNGVFADCAAAMTNVVQGTYVCTGNYETVKMVAAMTGGTSPTIKAIMVGVDGLWGVSFGLNASGVLVPLSTNSSGSVIALGTLCSGTRTACALGNVLLGFPTTGGGTGGIGVFPMIYNGASTDSLISTNGVDINGGSTAGIQAVKDTIINYNPSTGSTANQNRFDTLGTTATSAVNTQTQLMFPLRDNKTVCSFLHNELGWYAHAHRRIVNR